MKELLTKKIEEVLKELNIDELVIVNIPNDKINGDYSTNIALKLKNVLNKDPMDIALMIKDKINDDNIEKIEVKNPGFINFFVKKDYLFRNMEEVLKLKEEYGKINLGNGKKVNIEFVSANPTGILHLGNARGGAYGDSLARILSFTGYDVTKEYYINDAGMQINNLALSIICRYKERCGIYADMPTDGYYGKEIEKIANDLYDKYGDTYLDKDIEFFKSYGTDEMLSHIFNDLENYRIKYDVKTSEKKIAKKYNLNVIIDKLRKNGYVYDLDGATWFKCSSLYDDKDHVLIKEDGTFTYLVADIAYHYDKLQRGYDKIIDVLGTDHHGYVNRLKSSIKAMGEDDSKLSVKLLQLVRVVSNGEVVKMSKRSGKSITLNELVDEIGVNAARYYFSKYSLDTQMDIDINVAKENSNNNPVYYVCYAYARICSIVNNFKSDKTLEKYVAINNETSYNVLEKVYEFKEVVKNASLKESPHIITNYVYELAGVFHEYYANVKILDGSEEEILEKIMLIKSVKQTIFNALNLIGVIPPEKM